MDHSAGRHSHCATRHAGALLTPGGGGLAAACDAVEHVALVKLASVITLLVIVAALVVVGTGFAATDAAVTLCCNQEHTQSQALMLA